MKVLLCLLSDQHVPNLLSVHHFQPDQLVLVESVAMKKRNVAAQFLSALKLGDRDYEGRASIEPLESEDSLQAVREALRQAFGRFPSAQWIGNLTGGTKPMSIAAYEFFKALNGRLVYVNANRPAEMKDLETGTTEHCQYKLTIKEFLAGYGFEPGKADDKMKEAEARAERWYECARQIASAASAQDLLELTDEERNRGRDRGMLLEARHLEGTDPALLPAVALAFGLGETEQGLRSRKLTRHEVDFLTGGWLEVFFYGLLTRHASDLGIWDVHLGLEVRRCGDASGNDLDVTFMHNHGLSMIECKSGGQQHDMGGDVLYKVEAVKKQLNALRVRSSLATTGKNILDKEGNLKKTIQTRADLYGCKIVTADMIRKLADHPSAENIRSVLSL